MANGRGVSGKRGIGTGSKSEATSTKKGATPATGFKKTKGGGLGGSAGTANPGKGKNSKAMKGGKY